MKIVDIETFFFQSEEIDEKLLRLEFKRQVISWFQHSVLFLQELVQAG